MSGGLPVAAAPEIGATVRELLAPRRRLGGMTLLALVAASAAGLLGPLLLGHIIDLAETGEDAGAITRPAAGLALVALAQALLTFRGFVLVAELCQPMLATLRERVVDRALRLPATEIERTGQGDLLSRVSDDVAELARAVLDALPALAGAALTVLLTFAGLAVLDLRLAAAGLLCVPLQLHAVLWYRRRATQAYARERAVSGHRAQALLDAVGGAPTIRAFGLGHDELRRVASRSSDAVAAVRSTMRIATNFGSRLNGAELAGTASILVAGFLLVDAGAVSLGDATAGALLFLRLFDQFNIVLGTVDDAERAHAALARLVGIAGLAPPPEPPMPPAPADASVRAHAICHAYRPGHDVLHAIDLDLEPGERVALVGVSGAGKTTLARILAGRHPPTSGTVWIGGVDVSELGPSATRRAVGLVTQEVHVFAGPLSADLRLAAPHATDAELRSALVSVGALDWVLRLPGGLETIVGAGGHGLTAAQAQQVALARLALADPPIAVLDEATAEAGSSGARLLETAASAVLANRTALVVAHRLTQAASADRVIVLSGGRVIESGPHDALLAAGGHYAALWSAWSATRPAPQR